MSTLDFAERIHRSRSARNRRVYRRLNDRLRRELAEPEGSFWFACECGDDDCRAIVTMTTTDYDAVREDPNAFIVALHHGDGEERSGFRVVSRAEFDECS